MVYDPTAEFQHLRCPECDRIFELQGRQVICPEIECDWNLSLWQRIKIRLGTQQTKGSHITYSQVADIKRYLTDGLNVYGKCEILSNNNCKCAKCQLDNLSVDSVVAYAQAKEKDQGL